MFNNCRYIVGDQGTTYNANQTDKTYARVDGGTSAPGYLRHIVQNYAVYTSDNTTLTFYHDRLRMTRTGTIYDLYRGSSDPGWYSDGTYASVTQVVFDPSFANARPQTTWSWFFKMTNLQAITGIEHLNTSEVTNMSRMFFSCSSLESLDVSGFNTSNVTSMASMFSGCSALTSLNVTNFDTSNVTSMQSMFAVCNNLTSLDLSGFNTENVTTMHGMFNSSKRLASLDLSHFNTAKVTDMAYMFRDCKALSTLNLTRFNTSKVTDMSYMFNGCDNLTTIYASSRWSVASVTASTNMFTGCTNLTGDKGTTYASNRITYLYAHLDEGTSSPGYLSALYEGYVMYIPGSKQLTFFYDNHRFDRVGATADYDLNEGNKNPEWHDIAPEIKVVYFDPSFATARPLTTYGWFSGMKQLTSIQGIRYLNTEAVTSMGSMFKDCSAMTSLDVSGFNTAKVTIMGLMFSGCSGLTSLDVSNFNTERVVIMNGLFSGCSGLTSLDVSNFNTERVTNMSGMFSNCSGLTSLDVSNFNTARVTDMANMFSGCSGLTSLDVSNFSTEKVTYMEGLFSGCSGLTSLNVSNFNTQGVRNMNYMFRGCSNLTTIFVGINWSTAATTTSTQMFADCNRLRGGSGTTYNANHIDKAFAHVDGGNSDPGYLTAGIDAYVVLSELSSSNYNKQLTFRYDADWNSIPYTKFALNTGASLPGWYNQRSNITNVVFRPSFANARPTSTYRWFYGMTQLSITEIATLRYLNTSAVTNMREMFYGNTKLTTIDVSGFDTRNVTDMTAMFKNCTKITSLDVVSFDVSNVNTMTEMFYGCTALKTIYSNTDWNTGTYKTSNNMFRYCTSLVGGNGTAYNPTYTTVNYAHPDVAGTPGYFTLKFVLGDVNNDKKVTVADVTALTNHLLGGEGTYNPYAADVNQDGTVTFADLLELVNKILGK